MMRRIGARRDIDDDEFRHMAGKIEGEVHGDFPAHRVPDNVAARQLVSLHELAQVPAHHVVIEFIGVRGAAVIAEIEGVHLKMSGQFSRDGLPVVG